jgi:hypothetical protein
VVIDGNPTQHLLARLVAAYLERRLDAEERAAVEAHLATCEDCRREVLEVSRLILKRRRARQVLPVAGIAAAAVLALVAGVSLIGGPPETAASGAVRAPTLPPPARALTAVEPPQDTTLSVGEGIRFLWRAADPGSTYRLTVLDEAGGPVWSTRTSDTVAFLPAEAGPEEIGGYFWFVDALASDGSTLTSGTRRFSLR